LLSLLTAEPFPNLACCYRSEPVLSFDQAMSMEIRPEKFPGRQAVSILLKASVNLS